MRKRRKTLQNGRDTGNFFVALPHSMLDHPSWKSLSPPAKCIFIELTRRYNPSNNGNIGLSIRDAAKAGGCGNNTARKALQELCDAGFIEMNNKGHYQNRHATTWILTTQEYEGVKSNKWRNTNLVKRKAEMLVEHSECSSGNSVVSIQEQSKADSRYIDTVSGSERATSVL